MSSQLYSVQRLQVCIAFLEYLEVEYLDYSSFFKFYLGFPHMDAFTVLTKSNMFQLKCIKYEYHFYFFLNSFTPSNKLEGNSFT